MPIKQRLILVVGGAGYIGSHMVKCLQRAGYTPIVFDSLVTGHADAIGNAKLIIGDIHDTQLLNELFATYTFDAVMHFASFIQVNESIAKPALYYHNNVSGTLNLVTAMINAAVKYFIFSSSAAVYGEPKYTPIDEDHPLLPVNPYGRSKLMAEQMLEDFARSYEFKFAALRYFNAAGADASNGLSERHYPETHLIPLLLQAAQNETLSITIFGDDYATPDGTCVRDYVHVNDICDAHLLTLTALWEGKKSCIYNLGTGQGYSVQEVLTAARMITGCNIPSKTSGRRIGDPAILVADAGAIARDLNWRPRYTTLTALIESAWQMQVALSS